MGKFSGRTNLYTGKACVGVPNIAPVQKAAWLRKPSTQSGTFRSIYTHTYSGTANKENYDPEIPFPTLDLNSHLHLGGGPLQGLRSEQE